MAVVGSASIIVRAITTGVQRDIQRGFNNVDNIGQRAGQQMGGAFNRGFLNEAQKSFDRFKKLAATGFTVGPAVAGLISAISSVVSGLFALAAQASAAAPALVALGGAFAAAIQGAGALKLALAGVGAAISAGLKPPSSGGAARDFTAELDAIEQARRNLALVIERAGETEERVTRAVNEAWEDYQDSIIDTARAVDDLKRAQKEAAEQTQQLGFDVEDAALAQERAGMALEEARQNLMAVSDLPVDSAARKEAELAFKEADLNYRRAADRNNDLKQEQEEATAAGTAGAELLIEASNGVKEAKDAELEAFQAYEDAVIEAERARRDSKREILRAEEAILKAQEALNRAMQSGSGGVDQFAQAMAKLSPEARAFVRYIISIQDEFKSLRAAAGRNFFGPLTDGMQSIVANVFPMLRVQLERTGGALGHVAKGFADMLSGRRNLGALSRIMGTNSDVITAFGRTGRNLVAILIQLLDTARPLTRQFAEWTTTLARGWKESLMVDKKSGALSRTLNYAKQTAVQLGQVFKNLAGGLFNLGKAAAGPGSGGELLLDTLEAATRKFKDFTAEFNQSGEGAKYFQDVAVNFLAISRALGSIVKGFAKLGDNQGVADFFNTINDANDGAITNIFEMLERMSGGGIGKAMGEVANNITKILLAFTETGSIEIFFGIIEKVTDGILAILDNSIVQKFIVLIGAISAATTALWLMSKPILFIGKVWAGALINAARLVRGVGLAALFTVNPLLGMRVALVKLQTAAAGTAFAPLVGAIAGIGAGPILAIIAAIAALIAIFVLAYQNSEKLRESLTWAWDFIRSSFLDIWNELRVVIDQTLGSLTGLTNGAGGIASFFKIIGDALAIYVKLVVTQIMGIFRVLGAVVGFIVRVVGGWVGSIINFFKGLIDGIKSALGFVETAGGDTESFFEKVRRVIEAFWDVLSQTIAFLGSVVSYISSNFIQPVFKLFGWLIGWIIGFFIKPFIDNFIAIKDIVQSNWGAIVQFVEDGTNRLIDLINILIEAYNKVNFGLEDVEPLANVDFSPATESLEDLNEELGKNEEVAKRAAYTNDEFRKILESTETAALNVFDTFYAGRNAFVQTIKSNEELKDGVDSFYETLKSGDKTFREQKIALFDLGQQYIDTARKAIENGEGTDKAVQRIRQGRQAFIDGAEAMGITGDKAKQMADKLGLTPENIKKTFKVSGVQELENLNAQLDVLNQRIAGNATSGGYYAYRALNEERQILSAKIESQMTIVFGKGQSAGDPLFVRTVNPSVVYARPTAKGGIFPAQRGGHLIQVAEAGRAERVEPLDPNGLSNRDKALIGYLSGGGGGGMTVNVYPSPGMDERDLAEKVSRTIRSQMRKGAA
jgi:hypothetical protein